MKLKLLYIILLIGFIMPKEIQSENIQLRLSNNTAKYSNFKIDSDNILTISGQSDININNSKIINIATPINNADCATKEYVDDNSSTETFARRASFTANSSADDFAVEFA